MLKKHLLEILDFADLDVQENVIWDYAPWGHASRCFALRVDKPFEEAASKLAEFYVSLGAVAQGYAEICSSSDDEVESEGWSKWHLDAFPKYGRGEESYTVFYFPDGKVED